MKNNIFEIQPETCRKPLPLKEIHFTEFFLEKHGDKIEIIKRVLFFDPTEIYLRIGHLIDPYKRHQSIQMEQIFPKIEKYCACGCGQLAQASQPTEEYQWQRKWHSFKCADFASDVLSIINNYFDRSKYYIKHYYGLKCACCPEANYLELDHILPVKHGGGGCWLSNFEYKCKNCHNNKTNSDFGRKSKSFLKD